MKLFFIAIRQSAIRFLGGFLLLAWGVVSAQAEPNFLNSVPPGTSTYPAIARIGVDIPEDYDEFGTKEFVFDGVVDYIFEVRADLNIWRSGPIGNFQDPITLVNYGNGFTNQRFEMVNLANISITNPPGAVATSITLGDGVTGGTNSGPFFSTGGAVGLAPDGSTADGFLNLFMEVNLTDPPIPGPNGNYTIGELHNNSVLHLEAVIDKFAPKGIIFLQTGGHVGFFAPADHPLVLALDALPGPLRRPASEMEFARFIFTELQIVPEPSSIAFGLIAVSAFGTLAWRGQRIRKEAAA